jgi:hypothetical protein
MFDRDLSTWYRELFFPRSMGLPMTGPERDPSGRVPAAPGEGREAAVVARPAPRQSDARRRWRRGGSA